MSKPSIPSTRNIRRVLMRAPCWATRRCMTDAHDYSAMDFTLNNINLMRVTIVPICTLLLPRFYLYLPVAVLLSYLVAFRSPITRRLFATQRWMKQMLLYVLPFIYVAGAAIA